MEDKEFSLVFEVVCSYHPTELDSVGMDGIYIKEIRKIEKKNHQKKIKKGNCICTQLTALEPVVNPDCPIHGSMKSLI